MGLWVKVGRPIRSVRRLLKRQECMRLFSQNVRAAFGVRPKLDLILCKKAALAFSFPGVHARLGNSAQYRARSGVVHAQQGSTKDAIECCGSSDLIASRVSEGPRFPLLLNDEQDGGEQGALYQVSTGALYQPDATPQLTVLWTVQHPTPIPMGPGG